MSIASNKAAEDFLRIAPQFQLGGLVTESSHPVTANLSETARRSVPDALGELFRVDDDVLRTFAAFVDGGRLPQIAESVLKSLRNGGRVFFTGCGSTGRLSILLVSIWRDFFQRQAARGLSSAVEWENRAFSAMAGGDFALIKSVEGFEDFTQFGRRQLADLGVRQGDVVFAITEGGETSFVIGTAWEGLEAGAKVYFVYNNPDDVLRPTVQRSREVIDEPRIEKINLTTGPMAITGSTRMQATTIQLAVLVTVLEMVIRDLMTELEPDGPCALPSAEVPQATLAALTTMLKTLQAPETRNSLAALVEMEESIYRSGHRNSYFAKRLGIDVLTDTTERSPTFCTPPFRKFDDTTSAESWAFLFVPFPDSASAWRHILKREPDCVEWSDDDIRRLVPDDRVERTIEIVHRISTKELMRFRIGEDGRAFRPFRPGDGAVAVIAPDEGPEIAKPLLEAREAGALTGAIVLSYGKPRTDIPAAVVAYIPAPDAGLLLDGVTRLGIKMLLNAVSTCTMVRLGRVMGNTMIWVVPSNLKLIDRSTRYVQHLTGLGYEDACRLVHEVMEYVAPRMLNDQAYPPVVGVSVLRARHGLTNEAAEERLYREMG
jgi:N-acetylmuramic acid 6-phosphate etherase